MRDLVVLLVHLGRGINVHAEKVLVHAKKVDNWVPLVHKHKGAVGDLQDVLSNAKASSVNAGSVECILMNRLNKTVWE